MSVEKIIAVDSENHWVSNFYLNFLYLGFILFLHFYIEAVEVAFENCIF